VIGDADTVLGILGGKSQVRVIAGAYRGLDGLRALVDFDGGRVPAHFATGWRPGLNDPVWVTVVDGVAFLLGPTAPPASDGTVVSVASGIATISTDIGTVEATYNSGVTLTAGQEVKLLAHGGYHVVGVKSTSPTAPTVPDGPGGGGGRKTVTFTAIDSGSYQAYWWNNDVWSSASNKGLWFYGNKIRDTIPDSAVIVRAQIYLPPPIRLTGARPFGVHGYATKPPGAPTISSTSTLPGTSGWVDIPTNLIDHLKANTGGLGFDIGGWNIWPGVQRDGQSGAIRVTYDT